MVTLLIGRYIEDIDWQYLEKKGALPENNILDELKELKERFKGE